MLADKGVTVKEELPQTEISGTVAEIRSAVLDGNTTYFLRLEGSPVFYALSVKDSREAVTLNVGDEVTIQHEVPAEDGASILDAYSMVIGG